MTTNTNGLHNYDSTCDIYFVNNFFGTFYSGILSWMKNELFPRTKTAYLGTYEKAIQYIKQQKDNQHHDGEGPSYRPIITLDPSYDFEPWDGDGKQYWAYPFLSPGLGNRLFDSVAGTENQNFELTPIFTRYNGVFEVYFWVNSVYELLDLRILLYRFFGGINRWVRPKMFESFICIPDDLYNLKIDGQPIEWINTPVIIQNVDNIGKSQPTIPFILQPMFRLSSISDQSQKFGSSELSDHKLSISCEWMCNIPTYMRVKQRHIIEKIALHIDSFNCLTTMNNTTISEYSNMPIKSIYDPIPVHVVNINERTDQIKEFSNSPVFSYIVPDLKEHFNFIYSYTQRFIHMFNEQDIQFYNENEYLIINNEWDTTQFTDQIMYTVKSYNGIIKEDEIEYLEDTNQFKITNLTPKLENIVEFYLYEK